MQAKNQLHPSRFLWDFANILQTCYFGYFGQAWLRTRKVILSFSGKLSYLSAGKNYILHIFLEILQRYPNLFCVLRVYLATTPTMILSASRKRWCLPACKKINFIIHFFFEILHSKESCNLIGSQHFGSWHKNQNYRWNINDNISFHFQLLPWKNNHKIFQKIQNPKFSWKKGLCQFLNIPIIYHCAKNQKKIMSHCRKKCQTDGRTDEQTDILGRGSKKFM